MRVVLDASAAIAIALGDGATDVGEIEEILAPDLFIPEVVNGIWKYHRFSGFSVPRCEELLELATGLVDSIIPTRGLYRETFMLARATKHSAYELFYVVLARREGVALLTHDKALHKLAQLQGVESKLS